MPKPAQKSSYFFSKAKVILSHTLYIMIFNVKINHLYAHGYCSELNYSLFMSFIFRTILFCNSQLREASKNILRGGLLQSCRLRPQNADPPYLLSKGYGPPPKLYHNAIYPPNFG